MKEKRSAFIPESCKAAITALGSARYLYPSPSTSATRQSRRCTTTFLPSTRNNAFFIFDSCLFVEFIKLDLMGGYPCGETSCIRRRRSKNEQCRPWKLAERGR